MHRRCWGARIWLGCRSQARRERRPATSRERKTARRASSLKHNVRVSEKTVPSGRGDCTRLSPKTRTKRGATRESRSSGEGLWAGWSGTVAGARSGGPSGLWLAGSKNRRWQSARMTRRAAAGKLRKKERPEVSSRSIRPTERPSLFSRQGPCPRSPRTPPPRSHRPGRSSWPSTSRFAPTKPPCRSGRSAHEVVPSRWSARGDPCSTFPPPAGPGGSFRWITWTV